MNARLPGLRPADLDEEQSAVYRAIAGGPRAAGPFALTDENGCLRGPFNAMLLSPPIGQALQAVGAAVRYRSVLTDRIREMATLIVAAYWGSEFEWNSHEAVGRGCGVTAAELASIRRGSRPDVTDMIERVAVATADALTRNRVLTDAQYAEAVSALGLRRVFELTALVGYYATLALQLRVFAGEGGNDAG